MKLRVVGHGTDKFKIQKKNWLVWDDMGKNEFYYGMLRFVIKVYNTENEASEAMVKILVKEEQVKTGERRSKKVFKELTSTKIREKFPEYFT